MQEAPKFLVTEEEFDHLVEELQKTKDDLIEAKLDIWEWEFDKEHIHTLEQVIHEQKVENEELTLQVTCLKDDIRKEEKEKYKMMDKVIYKEDQISNLERALRQEIL